MVKHTNPPRNPAIADALLRTRSGKDIAFQARREIRGMEIANRIRQMKELCYRTFVSDVPAGHNVHRDVYQDSKQVIRQLGAQGGVEYDRTLAALKFAWTSQQACWDAVKLITTSR
jgi:hypothetical protein